VTGWALRTQGASAMLRGLASTRDRTSLVLVLGSQVSPKSVTVKYRRRKSTP
jgi:hypothetical protein